MKDGSEQVWADTLHVKELQDESEMSEEKYRIILESVPVGIMLIDPVTHIIVDINNFAAELFGESMDRMLGLVCHGFICPAAAGKCPVTDLGMTVDNAEHILLRKGDKPLSILKTVVRFRLNGRDLLLESFSDISALKSLQKELVQTEQNYRLLAEHMSDIVWIMDEHLNIQWLSPSNSRLRGYSLDEIYALPLERQMTPDSLERSISWLGKLLRLENEKGPCPETSGKLVRDLEFYCKDGHTVWLECTFQFLRDTRERITGIIAEGRDITERRFAYEQLREAQELYNLLAQHTSDSVWLMDMNLKTTYQSPSVQKMRGLTLEEIAEMPLEKHLAPESLQLATEMLARELPRIEDDPGYNPVITLELEFYCKDGTTMWAENKFSVIRDANGRAVSILGEARDITERKEAEIALQKSEATYQLLAEHMSNMVWIMDLNLNILWLSPSSAKVRGFSLEEMATLPLDRQLTPESLEAAMKLFEKIMRSDREGRVTELDATISREFEFYCKDGHVVWLDCTFQFIRDKQGKVTSILAEGRDITQRKQTEASLQETLEELKRSNAELEQFAYVASHDMQEPLRMISSYVQLLEKRYKNSLDGDALDFINYAVSGARRMQNLINDLLEYSRVGTRGRPLMPVESCTALETAVSNLEVAISEAGAVIEHGALPRVLADEGQLVQVFQNLVGNAIKFHGEAAPLVRIEAMRAGADWVFTVKDNGIGIDPQYHERIFMVFQRLHSSDYPGTGVGLAIARKIVQRHGGRMWLESQPGRGSIFYFTIPAREKGGNSP